MQCNTLYIYRELHRTFECNSPLAHFCIKKALLKARLFIHKNRTRAYTQITSKNKLKKGRKMEHQIEMKFEPSEVKEFLEKLFRYSLDKEMVDIEVLDFISKHLSEEDNEYFCESYLQWWKDLYKWQ